MFRLQSLIDHEEQRKNHYCYNQDFNNGEMNVPNSMVVSYEQLTNDSTAKTQYSNYTNYKESYARTIGLTYRELTHWEYQPTEGFRNGFSVVMRATKYQ